MDMPLHAYAYVSTAREGLDVPELDALLADATAFNRMAGVTGALMFDGSRFLQYIEGPRDGLASVHARIGNARRHGSIIQLAAGPIPNRWFPRWTMANRHVDAATLDSIVAEITNTPWKERHAYVLPVAQADAQGRALCWSFDKQFHVSPFMQMDCEYRWRFTAPGDDLHVHMQVWREGACQFDADLVMQRHPLTGRGLAGVLLRYPLMTLKVVAAIHWQALRLWLKRNPVHDHPSLAGKSP